MRGTDQPSAASRAAHRPGVGRARRAVAAALVLVGDGLALAAFFHPWLRLSASFAEAPGVGDYSPRLALQRGVGVVPPPLTLGFLLPLLCMVGGSIVSLVSGGPRARTVFVPASVGLAGAFL